MLANWQHEDYHVFSSFGFFFYVGDGVHVAVPGGSEGAGEGGGSPQDAPAGRTGSAVQQNCVILM